MIGLEPLGDRAFLARFAAEPEAAAWASAVRAAGLAGVLDAVAAYATAAVYADPDACDLDALGASLSRVEPAPAAGGEGRLVTLPVFYNGADLAPAASVLGLTPEAFIQLHSGCDYRVFAIGFLPGFPYAGYLPPELARLPRRESPRTRVPAGSVAIAGRQTGVYPGESPGGWHLIGRTPLRVVDLARGRFPIAAGDRLRFAPIGEAEFLGRLGDDL